MTKKRTVQNHHISYNPEVAVPVFKGEHHVLTLMQLYCRKVVSRGFIVSLKTFIAQREHEAVEAE